MFLDPARCSFMHQFPRPSCCSTSLSLTKFKNLVRGHRMERACSLFRPETTVFGRIYVLLAFLFFSFFPRVISKLCRLISTKFSIIRCPVFSCEKLEKLEQHLVRGNQCGMPISRVLVWVIGLVVCLVAALRITLFAYVGNE